MSNRDQAISEDMYQQIKENIKEDSSSEEKLEVTWHDILAMSIAALQIVLPLLITGFVVASGIIWLLMSFW